MTDSYETVKRRVLPFTDRSYTYGVITSAGSTVKPTKTSHVGYEETISHKNVLWLASQRLYRNPNLRYSDEVRLRRILSLQDLGWGFYNYKNYYSEITGDIHATKGTSVKYVWSGNFSAHRVNSLSSTAYWPDLGPADWDTVRKNGATAIARVKPNDPAAGAAQFIGELREELPSIPLMALRDRAGFFRGLGSEYLNVEFGWLPFVGDIQKMVSAARNHNRILGQFLRDSGRVVKRTYSFPSAEKSVVTDLGVAYPQPATPFPSVFPAVQYPKTLTEVTGRYDWFVGKFVYHIPGTDSLLSRIQRFDSLASKLLGTRITPELLWELAPWSWLVDWFGNVGDVIANFSSLNQDNQVMPYAYSMSTVYKENRYTLSGSPVGPLAQTFGTKYQLRLKASPYGFGVDWPDFSAYQLAILAALGISRR